MRRSGATWRRSASRAARRCAGTEPRDGPGSRFEPPSPEAIRSGLTQVRAVRRRRQRVARGEARDGHRRRRPRRGVAQRGGHSCSRATSHSASARHCAELGQEVAVDLDVGRVALGDAQQAGAPGEERGSGGASRPWKRFQVIADPHRELSAPRVRLERVQSGRVSVTSRHDTPLPHRRGAGRVRARRAARSRPGAEGGSGAARGREALAGRSVALVFEKPSTRTRVSFEVGVAELGGTPLVLRGDEMQLTRGESVARHRRVLSRYVDAIVIRSGSHELVDGAGRVRPRSRWSTR